MSTSSSSKISNINLPSSEDSTQINPSSSSSTVYKGRSVSQNSEDPFTTIVQDHMTPFDPTIECKKERTFTSSFNLDEFLKSFPRNIEEGQKLLKQATNAEEKGIQKLLEIPEGEQTFDNIVMAYHDMMTSFDALERLIRSERLIADDAEGKQALLDQCIALKDEIFSHGALLSTFISFTNKMLTENVLSSVEWECLKGIIDSIQEKYVSSESLELLKQVKEGITQQKGTSFVYLQGAIDSKVVPESKKAFSFLTLNLCIMPEANSMIYGGILPWPVRMDAIAEEVTRLNPDILFLQEVYDVRAITELHKRLASSYAHFYGNVTPRLCGFSHNSLFASSGLAIISKFKLENVSFEPYSSITAEDRPSGFDRLRVFGFDRNYGIFHCDVMNGRETLAHMATTHENPFYVDIRENQTKQIVKSFAQRTDEHIKHPFILCGDLNIQQGDLSEGGERLIKENFVDKYTAGDPTWFEFGHYWHKWLRDVKKFIEAKDTPWTVDRSLLWSSWANKNPYSMKVERVLMNDLQKPEEAVTDHHGIMTHFTY